MLILHDDPMKSNGSIRSRLRMCLIKPIFFNLSVQCAFRNVEFLGYLARDFLDLTNGGEVNVLCREHHRGITGVNTCELDVLTDRILHHLAIAGNSVELDLLRALHEL